MLKKITSGIALVMFLAVSLTFAFNIRPVNSDWTGTVYVLADGSVDPADAPIITQDNITYTLTGNITSSADGIVVKRDNIVIDGAGYTLQGEGHEEGIELSNRVNVTIQNINIQNFGDGISLWRSSSSSITGNSITGNIWAGIRLMYFSNNNNISGNNVTGNSRVGISLQDSSNNSITGNTFIKNGLKVFNSYDNVVVDNFVNGKPLVYLEAVLDYTVADAGQVILVKCDNIRVRNLNLSHTTVGVQLWQTNNTEITGNNITNNQDGIWLWESSGNVVFHNNFVNNTRQAASYVSVNVWDDGYPSGGNYWSGYTGVDADGDGVGDALYTIDANNTDRYPFMGPITFFDAGTWNGTAYFVNVVSNSTVSNFHFNPEEGAYLRFTVAGESETIGFCRVTIPKSLLWVENGWNVSVDGKPLNHTIIPDENYTYLYFTYNHTTQTITIQGTHVIPEFPSAIVLSLFLILSAVAAALLKKHPKNATTKH